MNNVLVTGGAGFFRSHVAKRLVRVDCRAIEISI